MNESNEWNVMIGAALPRHVSDQDTAATDRLSEFIEKYGGTSGSTTSLIDNTVEVHFGVEASDIAKAAATARSVWSQAAGEVGLQEAVIDQLEVLSDTAVERTIDRQGRLPQLVGLAEVAELLHVSKGRIGALRRKNPEFPKPLDVIRAGPIWAADGIKNFERSRCREPGRPAAHSPDAPRM